MSMNSLESIASAFREATSLILSAHQRPDGDAAGSLLGLAAALREQGRDVYPYIHDPLKRDLMFLPGSSHICNELPGDISRYDLVVMLDCHESSRLGPNGDELIRHARKIAVLDHHLGEGLCSSVSVECFQFIDPQASATGSICLQLLDLLGWPVSKETATCLYAAIMTDTGGFAYSNTRAETFEMARRLVEYGADPFFVSSSMFENRPLGQLRMLGEALSGMALYCQGRFALMQLTPEMFKKWGCDDSDVGNFVSYARSVEGVEVAAILKEMEPGQISVSLRSKHYLDVATLASEFGGGGHFHAAGFRISGKREEVVAVLRERVSAYLAQHDLGPVTASQVSVQEGR